MGAELFDLSWVQATVRLFTLFGWSLFAAGTVAAIFGKAFLECEFLRLSGQASLLSLYGL